MKDNNEKKDKMFKKIFFVLLNCILFFIVFLIFMSTFVNARVSVFCEPNEQTIKAGETAKYDIKLRNDDTTPTDIRMEFSKPPKNWNAEFSEKEFHLLPSQTKHVYFYLTSPKNEDNRTIDTIITIWYKRSYDPISTWQSRAINLQTTLKNPPPHKEKNLLTNNSLPFLPIIIFSTAGILLVVKSRYLIGKGALALYYRTARSQKREEIYNCIKQHNGIRTVDIENILGINRETARNHLKRLEGKGLILQGENKMFYPAKIRTTELTYPQQRVFGVIKENEGITPAGIANILGRSRQFVNYHLTILEHKGYVKRRKGIKGTYCYTV